MLCYGNARILHQTLRSEYTTGEDGSRGFGGAVGGSYRGEDDGSGASHGCEERLYISRLEIWIEEMSRRVWTYGIARTG